MQKKTNSKEEATENIFRVALMPFFEKYLTIFWWVFFVGLIKGGIILASFSVWPGWLGKMSSGLWKV